MCIYHEPQLQLQNEKQQVNVKLSKKKNVGSALLLGLVVGQWLVFGQWAAAGKRSSAAMNAAIQGNVWLTFSIVYVQHCTGRAGGGDTAQGRRKQRQA